MARHSKLTPELQDKICKALKLGHPLNTAAPLAGVTVRTAHSWLARGRKEDNRIAGGEAVNQDEAIYLDFLIATGEATSHAVDRVLQNLAAEADQNPKVSQWLLSHYLSGSRVKSEEMEERIATLEASMNEAFEEKEENKNG